MVSGILPGGLKSWCHSIAIWTAAKISYPIPSNGQLLILQSIFRLTTVDEGMAMKHNILFGGGCNSSISWLLHWLYEALHLGKELPRLLDGPLKIKIIKKILSLSTNLSPYYYHKLLFMTNILKKLTLSFPSRNPSLSVLSPIEIC